jgi:hypothetical protein
MGLFDGGSNGSEVAGGSTAWETPGTIGSTTPNTGQFTTISGTTITASVGFTCPLLGTNNESFGSGAGVALAAGADGNTLLGKNAGNALTTGDFSVAIGYRALLSATIPGECVAIGANALDAVTTTSVNAVGIGFNALTALTTGTDNVAIGHGAMAAATSSSSNVAIGKGALATLTTDSSRSVAIGFEAMNLAGSGTQCVGIGYQSLANSTSSPSNVAIGYRSMNGLGTGSGGNVAIGRTAMEGASTGDFNTAIGYQALKNGSGHINCTAIGSDAMGSSSVGSTRTSVVAIGYFTLNQNAGDQNSIVGATALQYGNGSSDANSGIGFGAMGNASLTSANKNSFVGFQCLQSLTTGSANAAIGYKAGYAATTASNTFFVGDTSQHASEGAINTITVASSNAYGASFSNAHDFAARTYLNAPNTAPTDADLQNARISFYLDESGHNLKIRVRYADATLKLATVALA